MADPPQPLCPECRSAPHKMDCSHRDREQLSIAADTLHAVLVAECGRLIDLGAGIDPGGPERLHAMAIALEAYEKLRWPL